MIKLPKVLAQPKLPDNLPKNAKWLSGEGAGSWFIIESKKGNYQISRYSPVGKFECSGEFFTNETFDINSSYKITYPSYCSKITVIQNGKSIVFLPV